MKVLFQNMDFPFRAKAYDHLDSVYPAINDGVIAKTHTFGITFNIA